MESLTLLGKRRQPENCDGRANRQVKRSVSLTCQELGTLCMAVKHVPERLPKRWDLISMIMSDSNVRKLDMPRLTIGDCSKRVVHFNPTPACCKDTIKMLMASFPDSMSSIQDDFIKILHNFHDKIPIKPIILLPPVQKCCDEPLMIRNRPSFPIVYTRNGTSIAALFSGECKKGCGKK